MVEFFFFSSRRRHTRSKRDWSSDVCSSDLQCNVHSTMETFWNARCTDSIEQQKQWPILRLSNTPRRSVVEQDEIGRASCREGGSVADAGNELCKEGRDCGNSCDVSRK